MVGEAKRWLGCPLLVSCAAAAFVWNAPESTSPPCSPRSPPPTYRQSCTLECDACGLQHLVAPLLTRAVSHPPPPCTHASGRRLPQLPAMTAAAAAAPVGQMHCGAQECSATEALPPAAKRLRAWRSAAEAAAGVGVLSVVETRIKVRADVWVWWRELRRLLAGGCSKCGQLLSYC